MSAKVALTLTLSAQLTSGVSLVFQNRSSRPAACAAVTYDRANAACSGVGLLDVGRNCVMSMSRQHHRCAHTHTPREV